MARFEYDMIVVGGGAAGLTTASGCAQLGMKTLIVERENKLGGDCLHYGCVPSKTLIKSAKVCALMKRAQDYGLPEPSMPLPDFERVAARIRDVIEAIQPHDSPERFASLGAETVFGTARFTDEHTVEVNGKRHTSKFFTIATGSEAFLPSVPGLAEAGCLTNREIFCLDSLPSSIIVLGGGPIACELGQAFARLGSQVTLIQRSGQILSREDEDMAAIVAEGLRADSVDVMTGAILKEVKRVGKGSEVICDTPKGMTRVLGARVLAALGRRPNIAGLGLEEIGVDSSGRGVETDRRMRTTQKHIFAAGDVTGKHQFTHAAGYEGGIVVANAAFRLPRKADYTWMPRCTYTDPELAGMGLTEREAKKAGVEHTVYSEEFASNDRAKAEHATRGRIKLLLDRKNKPIGIQIAGASAGDLLGEWVAVVNGRVGLSTLAGAVHPYPTFAELNKVVAGKRLSRKLFSPRVKKVLRWLFGYQGKRG